MNVSSLHWLISKVIGVESLFMLKSILLQSCYLSCLLPEKKKSCEGVFACQISF
uniref:Uncharacterized protein n=1 Tax=Nelumbo nucifera TaxID=4432 RepID=A0A822ZBD4_NELNU|nr:TPA_asm: hypothetical protein HUJ06_016173 [Nelumbo nucifera]